MRRLKLYTFAVSQVWEIPGQNTRARATTSASPWSIISRPDLDQMGANRARWDALTSKHGDVLLVKPMSFMNRSGYPLVAIAQFYKVVTGARFWSCWTTWPCRSAAFGSGRSGGTGGHNGLESIIMQFGTEEIPRLRIGIGAAPSQGCGRLCARPVFRRRTTAGEIGHRTRVSKRSNAPLTKASFPR